MLVRHIAKMLEYAWKTVISNEKEYYLSLQVVEIFALIFVVENEHRLYLTRENDDTSPQASFP